MRVSIIIILCLICYQTIGQTCHTILNTTEPTIDVWDWRVSNYEVHISGSNKTEITSPFHWYNTAGNPNIDHLRNDRSNLDFHPEDGWELLAKDMGTIGKPRGVPYFILYNRFNSKIRAFFWIPDTGELVNKAAIKLSFTPNFLDEKVTGLLEHANIPMNSVETFDKYATLIAINHYGSLQGEEGYWTYGDFPVAYDPCGCGYTSALVFEPSVFKIANIELTNIGSLSTEKPVGSSEQQSFASSVIKNFDKILTKGSKIHKSGKSYLDYMKTNYPPKQSLSDVFSIFINNITNASSNSSEKPNKSIKKLAGAAGKFFPVVSEVYGLMDLFVGGGQTKTTPMNVTFEAGLNFKTTGQITQKFNLETGTIYTPGAANQQEQKLKPVYNNVLGIFNVLEKQKVDVTYIDHYNHAFNYITCHYSDEGLTYAINPASGLSQTPVDLKVALFYTFKGRKTLSDQPLTNLIQVSDTVFRTPYFPPGCLSSFPAKFQIYSSGDKPEEEFENNIDISLQVMATLKRLDDSEETDHVLYVSHYKAEVGQFIKDDFYENYILNSAGTNYTVSEQMVGDYVYAGVPVFRADNYTAPHFYYNSGDIISLSLEEDRTISVLGRGILGNIETNGYKLTIIASEGVVIPDGMEYNPDIHIELGYVSGDCDNMVPAQTPLQVRRFCQTKHDPVASKKNDPIRTEAPIEENTIPFTAYPNPFKDNVIISYELEEASMVNLSIQNALGQVVKVIYDSDSQDDGQHTKTINTENLANGVYFAVLQIDGHTQTTKIIKQ